MFKIRIMVGLRLSLTITLHMGGITFVAPPNIHLHPILQFAWRLGEVFLYGIMRPVILLLVAH